MAKNIKKLRRLSLQISFVQKSIPNLYSADAEIECGWVTELPN
jgi:hypothetical protein